MKLSTAIRKGTKLDGKQHFGDLFDFDEDEYGEPIRIKGCCALGAAIIGKVGIKKAARYDYADLEHWFPCDHSIELKLPEGLSQSHADVHDAVVLLNDEAKWSRARIATWLEKHGY